MRNDQTHLARDKHALTLRIIISQQLITYIACNYRFRAKLLNQKSVNFFPLVFQACFRLSL